MRILSRHSPRPCFVDECTFTGLPPALVIHVRSVQGIVDIPRRAWARREDWLNVHRTNVLSKAAISTGVAVLQDLRYRHI